MRSVASRSRPSGSAPLAAVRRLAAWGSACVDRVRQRRALAKMDDRLLRDVGLSRGDVVRETAKSPWLD